MADSSYGYQPVNKCFTVAGSSAVSSASWVRISGFPGWNVNSSGYGYTVSMWLFPTAAPTFGDQEIWWTSSLDNAIRFGADLRCKFVVQHSGSTYNSNSFQLYSNSLTLNRWNHIAAYRSHGLGHMSIWQDGALVNSSTMPDWPSSVVASLHLLNGGGNCLYKGGYGQFSLLRGIKNWGTTYPFWNRYLNHSIISQYSWDLVLDLSDEVNSGGALRNRGIRIPGDPTAVVSASVIGAGHTWPSSSPLHPSYYLIRPYGYQGAQVLPNSDRRLNFPIESVSIERSTANAFHKFEIGTAFIRTSTRSRDSFNSTSGMLVPSRALRLMCDYAGSEHCLFNGYPKHVKPKYQSVTKDFGLTIEMEEFTKNYALASIPKAAYSVQQSIAAYFAFFVAGADPLFPYNDSRSDVTSTSMALRNWFSYPVTCQEHVEELCRVTNHWVYVRATGVASGYSGHIAHKPFSYAILDTSVATYTNAFYSIDPFVENVDHYNTVIARGIPRTYISTPTSIAHLATAIKVPPSTGVAFEIEYSDPGIEHNCPVGNVVTTAVSAWSTNTASDGTGTDMTSICSLTGVLGDCQTFGSYRIYNTSANSTAYLYRFDATGNPYRQSGTVSVMRVNSSSYATHGERRLVLESYLFQDADYMGSYATYIASNYGEPRYNVAISVKNDFPNCCVIQNGEIISLVHSALGLNGKYIALKVTHDIDSDRGIEHTMRLELEKY